MEISKLKSDISFEDFLNEYKIPEAEPFLSKKIADKVKNISTLRNLLEENDFKKVLLEMGISEKISNKLVDKFMNIDFLLDLEEMEDSGFKMFSDKTIYEIKDLTSSYVSEIAGKNIVITGTLSLPRRMFETSIAKLGGKVSSAVSKKTDILIYSTVDGMVTTKYKTALKINSDAGFDVIKFITEAEFNSLVKKLSIK